LRRWTCHVSPSLLLSWAASKRMPAVPHSERRAALAGAACLVPGIMLDVPAGRSMDLASLTGSPGRSGCRVYLFEAPYVCVVVDAHAQVTDTLRVPEAVLLETSERREKFESNA